MKNLLWLDDIRNPFLNEEEKVPTDKNGEYYNTNWVLNYEQFIKWINLFGLPDAISFDHDLADEHYTPEYFWGNYEESKKFQEWCGQSYQEKTGMDCAKWLVDYCMDNKKKLPEIFVHSANPVGADNIKGLLDNFTKHCAANDLYMIKKNKEGLNQYTPCKKIEEKERITRKFRDLIDLESPCPFNTKDEKDLMYLAEKCYELCNELNGNKQEYIKNIR